MTRKPQAGKYPLFSHRMAEKYRQSTLEDYGRIYIENIAQTRKEETVDVVDKVVEYIHRHLAEELSVRQLANMVYVSPDHLKCNPDTSAALPAWQNQTRRDSLK